MTPNWLMSVDIHIVSNIRDMKNMSFQATLRLSTTVKLDFYNWLKPQYCLKAPGIYVFTPISRRYADIYRHESGRFRTILSFLNYFFIIHHLLRHKYCKLVENVSVTGDRSRAASHSTIIKLCDHRAGQTLVFFFHLFPSYSVPHCQLQYYTLCVFSIFY